MRKMAVVLVTMALAGDAPGQFHDTRSMGFGGAPLRDGRGTLHLINPATYAAADPSGDVRAGWTLPLGLLQALGDFPQFDPDASDFDATHVLQWQLQPPGPLAIGRQAPLSEDAALRFVDGGFELATDRESDPLPEEGVHLARQLSLGQLVNRVDLGTKYGVVAIGVNGFAHHAADIDRREGQGGEDWAGYGVLQTGLGLQLAYAREIPLGGVTGGNGDDWLDQYWDREDTRPRLYVGAAARRLVGVAMTHLDGVARTGATGVAYDGVYSSSRADVSGGFAFGWSFDLGAVLRWSSLELGVSAADLGASLDWPDVRQDRLFSSLADQGPAQVRLAEGIRFETDLPRRILLHARVRRPGATWAFDLGGIGNRRDAHLGGEVPRGPTLLRGGLALDTRGQLQAGAGVGWRPGRWTLDLGLLTDGANLDGSRALTVGLAVGHRR